MTWTGGSLYAVFVGEESAIDLVRDAPTEEAECLGFAVASVHATLHVRVARSCPAPLCDPDAMQGRIDLAVVLTGCGQTGPPAIGSERTLVDTTGQGSTGFCSSLGGMTIYYKLMLNPDAVTTQYLRLTGECGTQAAGTRVLVMDNLMIWNTGDRPYPTTRIKVLDGKRAGVYGFVAQ